MLRRGGYNVEKATKKEAEKNRKMEEKKRSRNSTFE